MKLTLEEMETIIRWDRANPEAIVYTFEPSLKRKLQEMAELFPESVQLICEDNGSVEYLIPKSLITVRKPRTFTDEVKKVMKANGKKLAQSKRPEARQEQMKVLQAF